MSKAVVSRSRSVVLLCALGIGVVSCSDGNEDPSLQSDAAGDGNPADAPGTDTALDGTTQDDASSNGRDATIDAGPMTCSVGDVEIAHGSSATFYERNVVLRPQTCSQHAQERMCNAGVLGGDAEYSYASCEDVSLPASKPNIVYIMLDDAGYTDYGDAPYSDASIMRPNMKKFAAESLRIEQFYTAPMCTPTRMSLLSGFYPMRYGILWVCGAKAVFGIPGSDTTLPQALQDLGYHTASIGKWHSGAGRAAYEIQNKFDRSVESSGVVGNGYMDPTYTINGDNKVDHLGEHQTDTTAQYVIDYIETRADLRKPFFVNYWLNAPHAPHQPARRWERRYCGDRVGNDCPQPLRYKALLSQADEAIGRVLSAIDADEALRNNTIVVLHSDNGGTPRVHPQGNGPLRGYKTDVFEGGVRSPMYIRWPTVIAEGAVDETTVAAVHDVFPTLLTLLGEAVPRRLVGESFASALVGGKSLRAKPLFWSHKVANEHVETTMGNDLVSYAVRDGDWKLVFEPLDRKQPYLFNIAANSSERDANDLATAHPERVADLQNKYQAWLLSTSKIEAVEQARKQSVQDVAGGFRFSGSGGVVTLQSQLAFNLTRLDFSFATRIKPTRVGDRMVIASQDDLWNLGITPTGEVFLRTVGHDASVRYTSSKTKLKAGTTYDIAFVIYGFKSLDSVLRIFVREAKPSVAFKQEARVDIPHFAPSTSTIELGATAQGGNPYLGEVTMPTMSRAPLTAAQLDFMLR